MTEVLYIALAHLPADEALALISAHEEVNPPYIRPYDPEAATTETMPCPQFSVYDLEPPTQRAA